MPNLHVRATWRSAARTLMYGLAAGLARDRRGAASRAARRAAVGFWWDAFVLQRQSLSDPQLRRALGRLEREDLADLPGFLWALPFDLWRLRGKRRGRKPPKVTASDAFPYPAYYLHDFHNQHNGGLSARAAATYEWQIRFLFAGTQRIMRQAVIDRLPAGDHLNILDLGCGTAAWLPQARLLGRAHRVVGVDLSPAYLACARRRADARASFVQANAENLPDEMRGQFDRVVCIWLYHELPPRARLRVSQQMRAALRPGGEAIFMEAVQAADVPHRDIEAMNRSFARDFDEPYFASYQAMDLQAHFAQAQLTTHQRQRCFVSQVTTLRPR